MAPQVGGVSVVRPAPGNRESAPAGGAESAV